MIKKFRLYLLKKDFYSLGSLKKIILSFGGSFSLIFLSSEP
ncbi:MAG: hypothetical protein BAJALOKI1v1_290023 [Promethearchaeota archaeon]|nr:MAG: hypothetical protein BAJALOKI1v1_290023 [Candidatus Lokiarchaeota archaeon]